MLKRPLARAMAHIPSRDTVVLQTAQFLPLCRLLASEESSLHRYHPQCVSHPQGTQVTILNHHYQFRLPFGERLSYCGVVVILPRLLALATRCRMLFTYP